MFGLIELWLVLTVKSSTRPLPVNTTVASGHQAVLNCLLTYKGLPVSTFRWSRPGEVNSLDPGRFKVPCFFTHFVVFADCYLQRSVISVDRVDENHTQCTMNRCQTMYDSEQQAWSFRFCLTQKLECWNARLLWVSEWVEPATLTHLTTSSSSVVCTIVLLVWLELFHIISKYHGIIHNPCKRLHWVGRGACGCHPPTWSAPGQINVCVFVFNIRMNVVRLPSLFDLRWTCDKQVLSNGSLYIAAAYNQDAGWYTCTNVDDQSNGHSVYLSVVTGG